MRDPRGHGHVAPRADGVKARCGGPAICRECYLEWLIVHGERHFGTLWRDASMDDVRFVLRRAPPDSASNLPCDNCGNAAIAHTGPSLACPDAQPVDSHRYRSTAIPEATLTSEVSTLDEASRPSELSPPIGIPGVDYPVTPQMVVGQVMEIMQHLRKTVETALVGRFVRVKSDHNGQPYGRSRKSWRDKVCRIKSVHIDLYSGIQLCLEGREYECFIPASEVEFA